MINSDSIIAKAEEYFYFEDDLCNRIEEWARVRCNTFDCKDNEHPVKKKNYTPLFKILKYTYTIIIYTFLYNLA